MSEGNNVGASPTGHFPGGKWACFDRLPPELRRAVHEGVVDWDARSISWSLNERLRAGLTERAAIAQEVAHVHASDAEEVRQFQHHWPSRFGRHPHTAAQAADPSLYIETRPRKQAEL